MACGMLFYSFGWVACILPNEGTGGGASGLALVLCKALAQAGIADLQIGTMVLLINGILLLISGFIVGWNFGFKTIYCVVVLSMSMNMWIDVLPPGNFLGLQDPIVAIVLGVLLGTVGGDALTVAQMINGGELPGFVMGDIPWFLATMWAESPEYRSGMISNIGMGLLFAALGVWAILRKAGKEVADTKVVELK